MNNSQPKIVYKDDYIDLRSHLEEDPRKNLNQKSYREEWSARPKTRHERNEVVNTALKKLAKSYNTSNTPYEKKVKTRMRENSLYDPYRKKFSEEANSLKSKSELSSPPKTEKKNDKLICPSSPIIQSTYEKGDHQRKSESFKNKFTMTKIKPEGKEMKLRDGKNLIRDISTDNPVWKDQRLTEKYSLLKLPWKRSHTLPIFSPPSILLKENYKKKLIDNSDKKTYLYDDGSEVDSTYLEPKRPQYFGYIFQNQLLMLLNISAYICALLVISLIVWLISGNKFFHKWLIPRQPEDPVKKYIKFVGGSIVYTLTSIIRFIGRIFAIPTQQVYQPATEYSWPPVHYN